MATLKDIAQRVNRSVTTVSRALAGYSDVSPETISQVRSAADEMGYVPNTMARRLRSRSTETIGFVVPDSSGGYSEAFFNEFLAGVSKRAADFGYDLLVAVAHDKEDEIAIYRKLISEGKVDGFVLTRTYRMDARAELLMKENFPFAMFGRVEKALSAPYVDEDGTYAMKLITEHLLSRGHSRIACIGQPESIMFSHLRLQSVKEHLATAGIDIPDAYIRMGYFSQKDGYEQAGELLRLPSPPSAIICFNDLLAFGAVNAGKDAGFRIGKDLAVTGFDDIPMSEHYRPPLTTISQPIQSIGGMVVDLLFDRIQELRGITVQEHVSEVTSRRIPIPESWKVEADHHHHQLLLKPELIIRGTT